MTKKILVIEDERATRTNIVNFLNSEGFETLVAENGRIGIQLAQTYLPDLIICDVLMPELDGYDVLTTLQQDAQTASIPFIFLTVTASEAGFQHSLDLGADDYLSKPVTSEQLRRAIAVQLQNREIVRRPTRHLDQTQLLTNLKPGALLQFISTKDKLFHHLALGLRQHLSRMAQTIHAMKQQSADPELEQQLSELQESAARILSLVNEMTALHSVLTPENTDVLTRQFDFGVDFGGSPPEE
ncbi:MAG: response regulator [Synechococcales cyanobacterium C42_A2020_086]|jgi:CheY-like chemotaxis protein|nr:response regulator [Synechococcales cyanobacterium C42_A2020_086]